MTYDKNGNILKLLRSGQIATGSFGRLDSLTFKYTGMGNQVRSIADSVPDIAGRSDFYDATNGYTNKEYYYDKNGNMWLNRNKRMKTVYNYLNLPARISDTITPANKIEYVYTSVGEKLKQRLSTGTTLLYFGNYVYTLDGTANGIAVKYILTQEERATNSAGTYTYEYFMKDHLGSTRVSFNVPSTTGVIVQQDDYYPFGMLHKPQTTATSDNRYLHNGKEFQNNLLGGVNLDLYDYGARMYDPQIGRWHMPDPLAEYRLNLSPYNYVKNNPIRFIDLFGLIDTIKLPEVVVVAERNPPNQSSHSWLWILGNRIDYFLLGNTYERKVRNATNFENWMIRNVDQQILEDIAKASSAHLTDPALHNYVRSNESYEGTEDKDIIKEKAGNNQELIQNNPLVKKYTKESEKNEYDYKSEGKESDSSVVQKTYYFDDVDGDTVQDWKVHKFTNMGRPVSKKYVKKTK